MRREVEPELAENPRIAALCEALEACAHGDGDLMVRFLRDLLSAREMQDVANRWAAARMLMEGQTQTATARELAMSAKTVNDIAMWVQGTFATGGYWDAYERVKVPDARDPRATARPT
jgi:uncharacterized protein YerC